MTIQEALNNINSAVYGKDVRQSIHDGIELCYTERTSGGYKPQTDVNNFYSGIALFPSSTSNKPFNADFLLLAGGNSTNCCQVAFAMTNGNVPMTRRKSNGNWTAWTSVKLS